MGSKDAYVYFISPGQINVQAPDLGTGPVPVTVKTPGGTSLAAPQMAAMWALVKTTTASTGVRAGSTDMSPRARDAFQRARCEGD